jgi:phage replication O-like protein O
MKKIKKPAYTQVPNIIFDDIMKELTGAQTKILMCICRKTFGWQKEKDKISISQISEMTGLKKTCIIDSIKVLGKLDLVSTQKRHNSPTVYELIIEGGSKSEHHKNGEVQKVNNPGSKSEPQAAKSGSKSEPTKESIKETNKEKGKPSFFNKIKDLFDNEYKSFYKEPMAYDKKVLGQIKKLVEKSEQVNKDNPLLPIEKKIKILKSVVRDPAKNKSGYYSFTVGCLLQNWNNLHEVKKADYWDGKNL